MVMKITVKNGWDESPVAHPLTAIQRIFPYNTRVLCYSQVSPELSLQATSEVSQPGLKNLHADKTFVSGLQANVKMGPSFCVKDPEIRQVKPYKYTYKKLHSQSLSWYTFKELHTSQVD